MIVEKAKVKKLYEKLPERQQRCPKCGKFIAIEDEESWEYVKARSGTDLFWHRDCLARWSE